MIVFPNAKINIGLNVINKRTDGYHNIESIFVPVALYDILEIIEATDVKTEMSVSGINLNTNVEGNLVFKAYKLLSEIYKLPAVKIHLHKIIPTGAGLGGGSSDGAFALKLLNDLFALKISAEKLKQLALQLGSDCVFFIENQTSLVEGRGEKSTTVTVDLASHQIVIVHPSIHIDTKTAYDGITPVMPAKKIIEKIKQPIASWKTEIANDFETTVFVAHHAIAEIKTNLYKAGALYASMSGSGSSVYGIFDKQVNALDFPANYFVWKGSAL